MDLSLVDDLRDLPLIERKRRLGRLIGRKQAGNPRTVRYHPATVLWPGGRPRRRAEYKMIVRQLTGLREGSEIGCLIFEEFSING